MNTKKNLIRFDWAMKRLLRNKANFKILEGFLSELLKETIEIKNLLESESNQDTPFSKFNRVDLLAENSKGELILIEVQNDREIDYFQRMLFGVSKLITEHIQLGEDYINIKKVYSVNIIYFDLGQGTDYIYHGYTHFEGIHHHDDLLLSQRQQSVFNVKRPSGIMPEFYVIKVNQFDDVAKNTLDEWVFYLKNNIVEESFSAQGLDKVRQVLKIDSMTEQEQANYDLYLSDLSHERSIIFTAKDEGKAEGKIEGKAEGKIEGKIEGKAEGKIERQLEIAQNLLTLGLDIKSIAQATGLTITEVKDLSKN
jgi:predicted transposase/invertase (TIGR01784 family)